MAARPWRARSRRSFDAGATVDLPVGLTAVSGSFGAVGPVTVSAVATDADPAQTVAVAVEALAPVLSLEADDPHILLRTDGTGTARFTVGAAVADAESAVATLDLPVNLRADLGSGGPRSRIRVQGRAHGDVRPGDGRRGLDDQVLVNVRWAGSATLPTTVVVEALGATARSQSTVQTSSAGLEPRHSFAQADVIEIGAPLLSCSPTLPACRSALENGDRDNNALVMVPLDDAPPPSGASRSVAVSSTARLEIPGDREVLFAGLYWSANIGPYDTWSGARESARLRGPGGAYVKVAGKVLAEPTDNASRQYYQSFADVTDLVAARGPGAWSVADVAVSATATDKDRTYYAGWSLVVVFADTESDASVTVYDGGKSIGTSAVPAAFEFAAEAGTTTASAWSRGRGIGRGPATASSWVTPA